MHRDLDREPTPVVHGDSVCLIERFDAIALARPDQVALCVGGDELTFAALRDWSTCVADEVARCLGPGNAPVGILLGSSAAAVAAMLGIARTGRAFAHLDGAQPDRRLVAMIDLAGCAACVTDTPGAARIGDRAIPVPPVGPARPVPAITRPSAQDLACLLFTSGSTGSPKGIRIPHAMLAKDADAGRHVLGLGPEDRIGLAMPLEFVAGLIVAVWSLTCGATLCMAGPRRGSLPEVVEQLAHARITTLHGTPAFVRALASIDRLPEAWPALRLITTCGDVVFGSDVATVQARIAPFADVVNWTGTSETGVLALHRVPAGTSAPPGPVASGPAVHGIRLSVTSPNDGTRVPAGGVGELMVDGAIALGYCGDDPRLRRRITGDAAARRIRTGDLASCDPDGTLHLMGRADDAIKINGYLVEPREVEVSLRALHAVADAVVVAETHDDGPRLTAYVVPDPNEVVSAHSLRVGLRDALPYYLVPASIVIVPELPTTGRGKIDRAALSRIGATAERPPYRAPSPGTETYIARIWEEVLGVRRVGADDDFFALGGDSLAVEEVLSELQRLGPDLTSAVFARDPTVAGLAGAIAADDATHIGDGIVQLRHGPAHATIVCVAGAGGITLAFDSLLRSLDLDVPTFGVQMHALETRGLPDYSVARAARRLMRRMPELAPDGPVVLVGHSYGGLVALETAAALRAAGREVPLLALLDTSLQRPRSRGRAVSPRRAWRALPGETAVQRLTALPRMLTAGPVQYRGPKHYGAFWTRGVMMYRLHTPSVYDGASVVYAAESSSRNGAVDGVLTGPTELRRVPGNHRTMLREPFVGHIAGHLRDRIQSGVSAPVP